MSATLDQTHTTLDSLQAAMDRVLARAINAKAVVREARRLAQQARLHVLPKFVADQLRTLDSMTRMIEDPAAKLDGAARERLLGAIAYVAAPDDLIPDATPEIGLLDDAIVVQMAARELHTEIETYEAQTRRAMCARIERRREQRARRGGLFTLR